MWSGLHPMLVRCALMSIVVAGSGISGEHVDEADLVRRLGLGGDGGPPRLGILVRTKWRATGVNKAREAISTSLKRPWLAVLHHDDRCFGDNLLRRSSLNFREVRWLRGWDFLCRECK